MRTLLTFAVLLSAVVPSTAATGPGPWANGAYFPGQYDGRYSANVYNNTQARFGAAQMDTPAGNRLRGDTFAVTPGSITVSNFFNTNFSSTTTITNIDGVAAGSNVVTTNTIVSSALTNSVLPQTNVVNSGAASVVSGVLGFGIRTGTPATGTNGLASDNSGGLSLLSTSVRSITIDTSLSYFVIYIDGEVFAGQTVASINNNTGRVNGSLWNGVGLNKFERVNTPIVNSNGIVIGFTPSILQFPGATASGYFNAKIESRRSPFVFKGAGEISVRGTQQAGVGSSTYPFNLDGIKVSDVSASGYFATGGN